MKYKCFYESPIGKIILSSNGIDITGLWFDSSRFIDKLNMIEFNINEELEVFRMTKLWLDRYFNGEEPNPEEIPIELEGSDFSLKVWEKLKGIPYGNTVTYGDIAKQISKENNLEKMSAQAVGHAVGYNPISIIVPCHRVVGAKGNLTGYGGGLDKKIELLKIEKANIKDFYIPKRGNAL